jgi:hypothetical protein
VARAIFLFFRGVSFLLQLPGKPLKEEHSAVQSVPYHNTALFFILPGTVLVGTY